MNAHRRPISRATATANNPIDEAAPRQSSVAFQRSVERGPFRDADFAALAVKWFTIRSRSPACIVFGDEDRDGRSRPRPSPTDDMNAPTPDGPGNRDADRPTPVQINVGPAVLTIDQSALT